MDVVHQSRFPLDFNAYFVSQPESE